MDASVIAAPASVLALQRHMLAMPQAPTETRHAFAPGVYVRTLLIPADTLVVGKEHAKENVFILSKGVLLLYMPDGTRQSIEAPYQVVAAPGKKVAYALTDCITHSIHVSEHTDLELLERELIVPEEPAALTEGERKCLGD